MKMLPDEGQGVAFVIAFIIIGATTGCCSEPEVATLVRLGAWTMMILFLTMKIARFVGWREAVSVLEFMAGAIFLPEGLRVLFRRRFLDR